MFVHISLRESFDVLNTDVAFLLPVSLESKTSDGIKATVTEDVVKF